MSLFKEIFTNWNVKRSLNQLKIPKRFNRSLTLSVLETQDEWDQLAHLFRRNNNLAFPTKHQLLPTTKFIIAKERGKIIAAASIIRQGLFGIPADDTHYESVCSLSEQGSRVAELSDWVFDKSHNKSKQEVAILMQKYLYKYCTRHLGITHLVLRAEPKHEGALVNIYAAEKLSTSPSSMHLSGNLVKTHVYCVNFRKAYASMKLKASSNSEQGRIFDLFTKDERPNLYYPETGKESNRPSYMTEETLSQSYLANPVMEASLGEKEKDHLLSCYGKGEIYKEDELIFGSKRKEERYESYCSGNVLFNENCMVGLDISNVSLRGFRGHLKRPLRMGDKIRIEVQLDYDLRATLVAIPTWSEDQQTYGFSVIQYSREWSHYLYKLQGPNKTIEDDELLAM